MRILLEICCGSAEDAILACRAGAERVELNSDLFHGGLTPTLGSLLTVKKAAPPLEVMAMVRPREGGFCYTETEYAVMKEDARLLLENGADGLVFGFLHENGTVDAERTSEFATRVLTSGQRPTAPEGADTIAAMVRHAAGRIEILPGSGVRAANARQLIARTGCTQVHMSAHGMVCDLSAANEHGICFTGSDIPPDGRYKRVDPARVAEVLQLLKGDADVSF